MTSSGGQALLTFVDWSIEVELLPRVAADLELFCLVILFSWGISNPGRQFLSARQTPNLMVK